MATVVQSAFNVGEISPQLYGRVDYAKYRSGAARMRNFFVCFEGGASTRPGTHFVGQCYKSEYPVRLIPFVFSTVQSYILEFGHLYMRVVKDGAHVLEASKAVTALTLASPGVVTCNAHGYSAGDWVYFSIASGTTQLHQRTLRVGTTTVNTFQLLNLDGTSLDTSAYTAWGAGTVARVYTVTTPYDSADLFQLKFTQSADTMTLCHPDYAPRELTRTAHATWTLTTIDFESDAVAPGTLTVTASSAGTVNYAYRVTSTTAAGEESLPSPVGTAASVNISTTAGTLTVKWSPVSGAAYYNVYKALASQSGAVPTGAAYGFAGLTYGVQWKDANVTADFTKTPPVNYNPFAVSPITAVTVGAVGSGYADTTTVTITDATGSGASITPVVIGGEIVAYIIENGGSGYTAPTIGYANTGGGTSATATATVGSSSGTYPGVVTYFQQRLVFGGSTNFPATLWGSKPGTFHNFDYSNPTIASDSFEYTINSRQVNPIKAMVDMPGGLVVLTGGGAWQVSGGQQGTPVTATQALAQPQAYSGCSDLPPIVINYEVLYVQAKGSTVRDLSYSFLQNIYTGEDLSVLSGHLFRNYTLVDWCYADEPHHVVWAVRDDGALLSLTFLKEQEVKGWARHDTKGLFKSCAVITEESRDVPYFVVSRLINGAWVKYIEHLEARTFPNGVEDAWCVDSGLTNTLTYPAADITVSAGTGTATVTASASVFVVGDVGKVLRCGGGIATVTGYTSGTVITVSFVQDMNDILQNDDDETPLPVVSGDWSLTATVTTLGGLWHLEGQTVKVLADGNVMPDATVSSGSITIGRAASKVIVGLGYTCQLQTLDFDGAEPTLTGKMKKISHLTVKVTETRGLMYGPAFDRLVEFKQRSGAVHMGRPIPLATEDQRIYTPAAWSAQGRICFQQSDPLPATVLSVAPDFEVGQI